MKFYSTNKTTKPTSFKEAVFKGLPEDNGLFMPEIIPVLSADFFENISDYSLTEIAFQVIRPYVTGEIDDASLKTILEETLSFEIPLKKITDNTYSLELFHGPTLAFKDIGARFLARTMSHFLKSEGRKLNVLVATSGDTGSAVANGFYKVPNIEVIILYPSGKISQFQEQQMTTLGENITAIELDGTFDDCQHLVKQAFLDEKLANSKNLTSANSINVARLLPQSIYYFHAYAQLDKTERQNVVFSVPSGNYGNLTAGLLAQKMGLPVKHFIASANANNTVPEYLETGVYKARPSVETISNAMDVGNPSNFARLLDLYGDDWKAMKAAISGYSYSDEETRAAIKKVYQETGYILDPHGAVAYLGLEDYLKDDDNKTGIILETAHPIKFDNSVEPQIGKKLEMPAHLSLTNADKKSIGMKNSFADFKNFLEMLKN